MSQKKRDWCEGGGQPFDGKGKHKQRCPVCNRIVLLKFESNGTVIPQHKAK